MSNHQVDPNPQMGELIPTKKCALELTYSDVYDLSAIEENVLFLYEILRQRPPCCYISHNKTPSMEQHVKYVMSHPYAEWWIIHALVDNPTQGMETGDGDGCDDVMVGNIYLTRADEIGIFVLDAYQRQGIARTAITWMMKHHTGQLLANINPANQKSIELFKQLGFKHIQNTYRRVV